MMVKMNGIPAQDVGHSHTVKFHGAETPLRLSNDDGVAAESGQEGVGTWHLSPSVDSGVTLEGRVVGGIGPVVSLDENVSV